MDRTSANTAERIRWFLADRFLFDGNAPIDPAGSLMEAGILEGDVVIIRRCTDASNGDIVVALIDNEEATLKRLRKRGASVALEAANPAYETRIFGPDRVNIQGRCVGLIRRY